MGFEKPPQILNQRNLETNPEVSIRHFKPLEGGRDRFGNRFFKSPELAFTDREGEKSKAGLLLSKTGEEFIKNNPGILRKLEEGLIELEKTADVSEEEREKRFERERKRGGWDMSRKRSIVERVVPADIMEIFSDLYRGVTRNLGDQVRHIKDKAEEKMRVLDIGEGATLSYLFEGAQSRVYVLDIKGDRYIIKVKRGDISDDALREHYAQPYINEMLQLQEMRTDLHDLMEQNHVSLPEFLFTSSEVSCVKFEEGKMVLQHGDYGELIHQLDRKGFNKKVVEYVGEKRRTEPLWSNIIVDREKNDQLKYDNFIFKPDGHLVWIDPLLYYNRELAFSKP